MSSVQVCRMTEGDIDGTIDCIQKAFAEDPYNKWVFNDRKNVSLLFDRNKKDCFS